MLGFRPTFALSCYTFINRLFSSSSLSAIRVVSSAHLKLLIFLPAILIPACASSSPAFLMMYSAAAAKSLQSCPTLCNPIDSSPPGSPVPGILQARTLEWVAMPSSRVSFQPRDQTQSPTLQADSLPAEPQRILEWVAYPFSTRSS